MEIPQLVGNEGGIDPAALERCHDELLHQVESLLDPIDLDTSLPAVDHAVDIDALLAETHPHDDLSQQLQRQDTEPRELLHPDEADSLFAHLSSKKH